MDIQRYLGRFRTEVIEGSSLVIASPVLEVKENKLQIESFRVYDRAEATDIIRREGGRRYE